MAEKFLLDACAVIAYPNDEDGAEKVEELLWQSEQKSKNLLMHQVRSPNSGLGGLASSNPKR